MNRFKSIAMAAFVVVVAAAYALPALPAAAQSSASLSITPKKNYVIEPGKSVNDKLTIRNIDPSSDLNLTLRVIDFTFTGDGGTPKLFLAEDAPQTTWSLKPMLSVPRTVTVPKGSSKSFDMSVVVPAGHGAGSYYSAIVYSTTAPNGGNVGLSASGVTLVFTQIPGKVNEDLKLQKFGAYHEATPASPDAHYMFFTMTEPQTVAYTLQNNGNVVEAPSGTITLKNMFGKTYDVDKVNPSGSLALIGQARTFTSCIKLQAKDISIAGTSTQTPVCVSPGLWPGLYTASLDLFYGQNGNETREITGTAYFWYVPWWSILVVIIVLAILVYGIWRGKRYAETKLGYAKTKKSRRRK
jgi:hypothetical protein